MLRLDDQLPGEKGGRWTWRYTVRSSTMVSAWMGVLGVLGALGGERGLDGK